MDAHLHLAYCACMREALSLTEVWVPRWLGQLRATLRQRERDARDLFEKQALTEARVQLDSHRERFAIQFIEAFAASVQDARLGPGSTVRQRHGLSFDQLEPMGDPQVPEWVETARVQQMIKLAAKEELAVLNARLTRVCGLDPVRAHPNPLRTEVVVVALMRTLSGLQVDAAVRSRWLQIGALSMGHELQTLYARLSALLDRWGVPPAGCQTVQASASRPAVGLPRDAGGLADTVVGSDAVLTLDHLHQLLVGTIDQGSRGAPSHAQGNAMVRTLASEVVTLMMRRIAGDTRLLKPLRDLLQDLKPALLELARKDPRFFADRQNPARGLLDALTERSLAFRSEHENGYGPFAAQVRDTVRALQQPDPDIGNRLVTLLQDLSRSQAEALPPGASRARHIEPNPQIPPSREMAQHPEPWRQPAEARGTGFMDDALMETQPSFLETRPMQRDLADLKAEASGQRPAG